MADDPMRLEASGKGHGRWSQEWEQRLPRPRRPGRSLRGVHSVDWPCGQNPGRKPEGRQRASTREAMSLGEQSSTCRASTL